MGKRMDFFNLNLDGAPEGKGINRFGTFHGTSPNHVTPGQLLGFRTLLESLNDGTDLGFTPKDDESSDSTSNIEEPDEDFWYRTASGMEPVTVALPEPGPYYPNILAPLNLIDDIEVEKLIDLMQSNKTPIPNK